MTGMNKNYEKLEEEPFYSLLAKIYTSEFPINPENLRKVRVSRRLPLATLPLLKLPSVGEKISWKEYSVREEDLDKLVEEGYLKKVDGGYRPTIKVTEYLEERIRPRRAKLKEKVFWPLGLRYFHEQQDVNFKVLLDFSKPPLQGRLIEGYKKIVRGWLLSLHGRVVIPGFVLFALTDHLPPPLSDSLRIGALVYVFLLGYNYEECKAGEKVSELVSRYKAKVIRRQNQES